MKSENRKRLRDALINRTITDVEFGDAHGLVIKIVLDNGKRLSVCTYDSYSPVKHDADDFYVAIDEDEM
jgi:hypothetical protein